MRRAADAVMGLLAGVLVRVFFRSLDVTGADRLPASGPTVVVANHHNGLVDGLVLIAALGRYPRFLGKSTLWKILPLRPFLALAGVVPIYRSADSRSVPSGVRVARNDESLARCRALLAGGGMVAVFPEGISHDEFRLQELRTGAARIALGAAGDDGVGGVTVVAAGLVYDDKSRFRSRALVRVGAPRPVEPLLAEYRSAPAAAVHALTGEVTADLRAVAPDFATTDLAERSLAVAALLAPDLAERERLAALLARSAGSAGGALDDLVLQAARYHRDLAVLGLDDGAIVAPPGRREQRALAWSAAKVAAVAPLAGVGVVIHAVPYSMIKWVGRRPSNVGMRATVKLLGCFGLFTVTYLAIGLRVGRRRGWRAGLAAFAVGPLCGYAALRSSERLARMGGVSRSLRALRDHEATVAALRSRRAELVTAARRLL